MKKKSTKFYTSWFYLFPSDEDIYLQTDHTITSSYRPSRPISKPILPPPVRLALTYSLGSIELFQSRGLKIWSSLASLILVHVPLSSPPSDPHSSSNSYPSKPDLIQFPLHILKKSCIFCTFKSVQLKWHRIGQEVHRILSANSKILNRLGLLLVITKLIKKLTNPTEQSPSWPKAVACDLSHVLFSNPTRDTHVRLRVYASVLIRVGKGLAAG